jgi:hypothetical protein
MACEGVQRYSLKLWDWCGRLATDDPTDAVVLNEATPLCGPEELVHQAPIALRDGQAEFALHLEHGLVLGDGTLAGHEFPNQPWKVPEIAQLERMCCRRRRLCWKREPGSHAVELC